MSSATETAPAAKGSIIRKELYGYSIEQLDTNPETRYLPPPDSRTKLRRILERIWLGFRGPRRAGLFSDF